MAEIEYVRTNWLRGKEIGVPFSLRSEAGSFVYNIIFDHEDKHSVNHDPDQPITSNPGVWNKHIVMLVRGEPGTYLTPAYKRKKTVRHDGELEAMKTWNAAGRYLSIGEEGFIVIAMKLGTGDCLFTVAATELVRISLFSFSFIEQSMKEVKAEKVFAY